MRMYLSKADILEMRVYTIGNPLVAQTMMRHKPLTGMLHKNAITQNMCRLNGTALKTQKI